MSVRTVRATIVAMTSVLILWGLPGSASAGGPTLGGIPPGFDSLFTNPQNSHIQLPTIPGDFFAPGCDPVNAIVPFAGEPLGVYGGNGVGNGDTIVERLEQIPPNPDNAMVAIEIVELALTSVQPIPVNCPGGPQHWQLEVEISDGQQPGQMWVTQTGPSGGTFDAQFPVLPVLTFTRVSGGPKDVRTLDIQDAPPSSQNLFFFQLDDVPWVSGPCKLPAFSGPGINDQWCPGQAPDGSLVPIPAEAPIVFHDSFPAQPALEHFKCYKLDKKRFKKRTVSVGNQFENRRYRVKNRQELCNPAQKSREPYFNQRAHQQCYGITGKPVNRAVAIVNQWGNQVVQVGRAQRLCLPTRKKELPKGKNPQIRVPVEHFTCYSVKGLTPAYDSGGGIPAKVGTRDQFKRFEQVSVRALKWLCAPTDKNREGLQQPFQHLACYTIKAAKLRRKIQIKNQFERTRLVARQGKMLCLPTAKYAFPLAPA